MNEPALTYIAESIVKAVGVAGVEAMAMKKSITMLWNPIAIEFSEELIKAIIVGDQVRPERAENIMTSYRLRFADFVEAAAPYVEEYVGLAYDRGKEYTLSNAIAGVLDLGVVKVKKGVLEYPMPSLGYAEPFHDYYYGEGVTSSIIADRLWNRYELQREGEFAKTKKSTAAGVRQHSYDLQDRIHAGFLGRYEHPDATMPSYPVTVMLQKDQASIISELVSLTGSTKQNVQRTITRWFKETQGQYFERFIIPETARLASYADQAEGNVTTLKKIGQEYKKFVEADAYWSSVSEFNSETSKVWAQMQTLHEVGVSTYTIIAVLDKKTCAVCSHLHGTTWSVQEAVNKISDMIIMESEEAYERNPFPPRSTPKDHPDPQESPFNLPPFHPRCRCNVKSEHQITQMPGDVIARPFNHKKPPTDKGLTRVFNTYINKMTKKEVEAALVAGDKYIPDGARAMTAKEFKRVKEGFEDIPFETRKWAERNRESYRILITDAEGFSSRVYGNTIVINSMYVAEDVGTQVIQHELRHALINKSIMKVKGGGDTIWNDIANRTAKTKFRIPVHMNKQYMMNGGRGVIAAEAAADEFMAMIGDYYSPGMKFDDLISIVRKKGIGIEVASKASQITIGKTPLYWTAKEAKQAVTYWWNLMDIDDLTLLSKKQMLAKVNYLPMSSAKLHIATQNELRLRDVLRKAGIKDVFQEGDRAPYDVWIGADPSDWYGGVKGRKKPHTLIEIKTIIEAKNNKITMHTESLARKKTEWRKFGKRRTGAHTVVFDERTGKIYYKPGVGSYRLSAMQEVTEGRLQEIFGGKTTETLVEAVAEKKVVFKQITTKVEFNKFHANMLLVKDEHKKFLDWYTWEEYKKKGIRLFMSQDGQTGMGLNKNNMGVTLWRRADAAPGVGKKMMAYGIEQGMDKLECFDGKLKDIYSTFGFEEVSRTPFNKKFAPKGWNYKDWGKPDYLEMELRKPVVQFGGQDIRTAKYNLNKRQALKFFEDNDYVEVIKEYTEGAEWVSSDWNAVLRRSKTLTEAVEDHKHGLAIEVLYGAIEDAPKFDGRTYRGLRFGNKLQFDKFEDVINDAIKADDLLEWKGFTSTSFSKINAMDFMDRNNAPFKIMIQMETKEGVVLEAMSKWGLEEKEVLINAYSRFRVKSFRQLKDGTWYLKLDQVSYKPVGYVSEVAPAAERAALSTARRTTPASDLNVIGTIDEGNVNTVEIVTIGGSNKRFIYKPISGESYYAPEQWREAKRVMQSEFGITVNTLEDIKPSHWEYLESAFDVTPDEIWIRSTVNNTSMTLAEREAFALDVAHELGFNNDYAIVPRYTWALDEDGNRAGILIEFIKSAEVETAWAGRQLYDEERFQMAVFDFLIGNTDRHENNWMRKIGDIDSFTGEITSTAKTGRPVYIDHGYVMPGQQRDLGGLAEFRAKEVGTGSGGREMFAQMEFDLEPDYLEGLITRIQRFADDDIDDMVKKYGFVSDEVEALQYRADSLVEHLRGGTFSELMVKHREDHGLWGLEDSFIE